MNLKDLPVVLFQLELTRARLKIAELSAKSAEVEIYETICQNLVLVHFRIASFSVPKQPGVDLKVLSDLVLQSVRDLRNLSKKCYSGPVIENESELLDLLKRDNYNAKLGLSDIGVEGKFANLTSTDFLYLFLTLHNLLHSIAAQKRKLNSVSIYGSESGVRSVIRYSGLPISIGRLTSGEFSKESSYPDLNMHLLKKLSGELRSHRSIGGKNSMRLAIPLLTMKSFSIKLH
jgi:hypothetical protein